MGLYNGHDNEPRFNRDLNAQGSEYAGAFGHDESIQIEKMTNKAIFDASPKQFFDLKLLNMKSFMSANSDEFFFQEMGYQRQPVIVTVDAAQGAPDASVVYTVADTTTIAVNSIVTFHDNTKGVVVAIVANTSVTVSPLTGEFLPAITAAIPEEACLANHSGVEADKTSEFARHCKVSTVEKYNYIQLLSKAICYGEVEMFKLKNAAATNNFLEMERNNMFRQIRIDASNIFWNGTRGQVTLANGQVAKTTGGVVPTMADAQSPTVAATLGDDASIRTAVADLALATEFGDYGDVRFLFATPAITLAISQAYKSFGSEGTVRYAPNDDIAKLMLTEINLGSTRVVLIPFSRFNDKASFPASFQNTAYLLDLKNINLKQMWGERSGETPDHRGNGYRNNWKEIWVDMNIGVQFNNPLGSGSITFA